MKTTLSHGLVALLLLRLLGACQEPQVQTLRYRLKKVTTNYPLNSYPQYGYNTYNYNASNQLVYTRSFSVTNGISEYPVGRIDLTYDEAGKLIQSESKQDPDYIGHTLNFFYRYVYNYDSQNRLVGSKWYKVVLGKPLLSQEEQYSFGTGNVPIKLSRKIYNESDGSLSFGSEDTYVYDKENVISVTNVDGAYSSTYSYQYDDNPNPYYKVIVLQGFRPENLSKNNILESNQVYTYNDQGLLIKKAKKDGTEETMYVYETY